MGEKEQVKKLNTMNILLSKKSLFIASFSLLIISYTMFNLSRDKVSNTNVSVGLSTYAPGITYSNAFVTPSVDVQMLKFADGNPGIAYGGAGSGASAGTSGLLGGEGASGGVKITW